MSSYSNNSRFDPRNPPHALVIAVLLAVSVGLGFLGDAIITAVERRSYPRTYAELVSAASEAYGVPEPLIFAVIRTESGFDTGAVSSAGAVGLMQLMPDTFRWVTDEMLFEHLDDGMRYDPETNIRYGTWVLARYYARYGSWETALAAYNAGSGRVDEWLEDERYADGAGGLKKVPFAETRRYLRKVADAEEKYRRLWEWGN